MGYETPGMEHRYEYLYTCNNRIIAKMIVDIMMLLVVLILIHNTDNTDIYKQGLFFSHRKPLADELQEFFLTLINRRYVMLCIHFVRAFHVMNFCGAQCNCVTDKYDII